MRRDVHVRVPAERGGKPEGTLGELVEEFVRDRARQRLEGGL
jgi:hypothetical protein